MPCGVKEKVSKSKEWMLGKNKSNGRILERSENEPAKTGQEQEKGEKIFTFLAETVNVTDKNRYHTWSSRRADIVFIYMKERKVVIIDVAIPGDDRVKDKELEKLEKYQLLKDEIAKVWRMRKVIVVLVLLGPLEPYQSTLRSTWSESAWTWGWKLSRKQHCWGQQRY